MTDIVKDEYLHAQWTDKDCPECGEHFVARDVHGLYCCVCDWIECIAKIEKIAEGSE